MEQNSASSHPPLWPSGLLHRSGLHCSSKESAPFFLPISSHAYVCVLGILRAWFSKELIQAQGYRNLVQAFTVGKLWVYFILNQALNYA